MKNITEPTINGVTLRPLTSFVLGRVRAYVESEQGQGLGTGQAAAFSYAAIAMSDNPAPLFGSFDTLHDATVQIGLELTEQDAETLGEYINSVIEEREAATVETPEGKK